MTQHVLKHYNNQKVMLSSPVKLVSMLYNEAIRQLNIVIESIEAGQIEARWRANNKCSEIIYHMLITLDQERGGDIAAQLERLFTYILKRLPEIDSKNNAKAARDVINLLTPLAESWQVLADREGAEPDQEGAGKAPRSQGAHAHEQQPQDAQVSSPGALPYSDSSPSTQEDEAPKPSQRIALSA